MVSAKVEVGFDGFAAFGAKALDQGSGGIVGSELVGVFGLSEPELLGIEADQAMHERNEIVRLIFHELLEVVRDGIAEMPQDADGAEVEGGFLAAEVVRGRGGIGGEFTDGAKVLESEIGVSPLNVSSLAPAGDVAREDGVLALLIEEADDFGVRPIIVEHLIEVVAKAFWETPDLTCDSRFHISIFHLGSRISGGVGHPQGYPLRKVGKSYPLEASRKLFKESYLRRNLA